MNREREMSDTVSVLLYRYLEGAAIRTAGTGSIQHVGYDSNS